MYQDNFDPNADQEYTNPQNPPVPQQPPVYQPAPPTPKPPKAKKQFRMGALVAIALVCALVGGIVGAVFYGLVAEPETKLQAVTAPQEEESQDDEVSNILVSNRENSVIETNPVPEGTLMNAAQVYAQNVNSTVGITTSITTNFWGYQTTSAASGSGFIFSDDGYILTNFHVVEDSSSITVSMYDGSTFDATLVGYDESNDIAVLKIKADNLTPVVLGNSNKMNVGDDVVAIGNPLGELTFSLTKGTVSALNREITMQSGATMNLIQTDCAINSGNSGGALFNLYGEVVGITNAKYSSSGSEASIDNIGFAIPISDVLNIIESIIEKGYIAKPYVGISVSDVSAESQLYGLPQGAAIRSISEDSPAQQAGLEVGDIVTSVNGKTISGSSDLVTTISQATIGQELTLEIYRKGETKTVTVTVGEQVQEALPKQEQQPQQNQGSYFPGFGGW